ncbi:MAG TPA: response regulator [bacterium]|nr:response regulator [bacterium]HPJ72585.1 response regulator [bacterium]HPQ65100.1 response regulator [bacterium]
MSENRNLVLVVDDEEDLVIALKARFQSAGYEVEVARDGLEALRKARTLDPDVIILDVMLPKMDGFKVCRMLKFDNRYSRIPVLMLSARGQEVDQEMGKKVGADDYMVKPFDSAKLMSRVKELLGN